MNVVIEVSFQQMNDLITCCKFEELRLEEAGRLEEARGVEELEKAVRNWKWAED